MLKRTIFDIETIPQAADKLLASMPPFNPVEAKLGNLKDPAKIEAKLVELAAKHRADYIDNAALEAHTCHVKLAGFKDHHAGKVAIYAFEPDQKIAHQLVTDFPASGQVNVIPLGSEQLFLKMTYKHLIASTEDPSDRIVTYYGNEFDLPMIFRRLWLTGTATPIPFHWRQGRYWSRQFADVREVYSFGEKYYASGGLAGLLKMLGANAATGDGAKFGELYASNPSDGVRYLAEDLNGIEEAAEKCGVIEKEDEL